VGTTPAISRRSERARPAGGLRGSEGRSVRQRFYNGVASACWPRRRWARKRRQSQHLDWPRRGPLNTWPDVPTKFRGVAANDPLPFLRTFFRRLAKARLGITPDEIDGGHLRRTQPIPKELADVLETYSTKDVAKASASAGRCCFSSERRCSAMSAIAVRGVNGPRYSVSTLRVSPLRHTHIGEKVVDEVSHARADVISLRPGPGNTSASQVCTPLGLSLHVIDRGEGVARPRKVC